MTVFTSAKDALHATEQLARISQLYTEQGPPLRRAKTLKALSDLWKTALENFEQFRAAEKPPLFKAVYESRMPQGTSPRSQERLVRSFLRDLDCIKTAPVTQPGKGLISRPFFVSYPRIDAKGQMHMHSHVAKWTNREEVLANRLYSHFADGFKVPRTAAYLKESGAYENENGIVEALGPEGTERMEASLQEVIKAFKKADAPLQNEGTVLFAEKVDGPDILKFAATEEYKSFTLEEKQHLFLRFGQIAFLDLILGNTDRLLKVAMEEGTYTLVTEEANLENILIEKESGELYAIDNGLDAKLEEGSYNAFLQESLKNPEFFKNASESLMGSLEAALDGADTQIGLETLRLDLKSKTLLSSLQQGMQAMREHLKQTALPQGNPLLSSVEKRLQMV